MQLQRPMESDATPRWLGAKWVGEIDYGAFQDAEQTLLNTVYLHEADGYGVASLLVRNGAQVMGFIEVPIVQSYVLRADIVEAVRNLPVPPAVKPTSEMFPAITVVICTHNRAEQLDAALASVMNLDYPNYDVIVVENAPLNDATMQLISTKYPSVQYAVQPIKGLSQARNTGLKLATGDIIANTDDDVVVDRNWLRALAAAFAEDENIGCVTGLVPSGEFISPTQAYFDSRVTWSRILEKSYYSLAKPPQDIPAFPFAVGRYGTGANFAIRRSILRKVGKFDTAFGAGSRTGGGEDIDFFTRVLFARYTLVVEPNAIVWHRHRADEAALTVQARNYGIGLGAWLTKLALSPRMWLPLLRKVGAGRKQLTQLGDMDDAPTAASETQSYLLDAAMEDQLQALERRSVKLGPVRYAQQRFANAARVLTPHRLVAGWQRHPVLPAALLISAAQALLLVPGLPEWARGVLVGVFAFTAPGMLMTYRMRVRARTRALLIGSLSVSTLLIGTTVMAMLEVWYPLASLFGLAGAVIIGVAVASLIEMRGEHS